MPSTTHAQAAATPSRLAVYTTVYPQVLPYLRAWYASVLAQEDRDFDLWIGLDGLTPAALAAELDGPFDGPCDGPCDGPMVVHWCQGRSGESPAAVRARAIAAMVQRADAVVFTDSDDVLEPSRVAAARASLAQADVTACALRVTDAAGHDVGVMVGPAAGESLDALLPRWNVFGLSNTAYHSAVLRRCLPIPAACHLLDWLLVTRAWGRGARLHFDPTPHMRYRQYGANVACVLPPFSAEYVRRATVLVLHHYRHVLARDQRLAPVAGAALQVAARRTAAFAAAVLRSPPLLAAYVRELNALPPRYVWWWCVANPHLEAVWTL